MSMYSKIRENIKKRSEQREVERAYSKMREKEIREKERVAYYDGLEKSRIKASKEKGYSKGQGFGDIMSSFGDAMFGGKIHREPEVKVGKKKRSRREDRPPELFDIGGPF